MQNRDIALFLDSFPFMTYHKKQKLFEVFKQPLDIFNKSYFSKKKQEVMTFLDDEQYKKIADNIDEKYYSKVLEKLENLKIKYITLFDDDYPELLRNIDTPPFVLYYKGDRELLNSLCIGVVGSRKITNYGVMVTEKFTKELIKYGFTIVSGLAYGVDTLAHTETLKNKGKTIAVLAGGLDKIYPKANSHLADDIVKGGGLLVSEMPPNTRLEAHMFPIRNRIIAGLSKAILVTEAQESSGVMHTKNYALDYGRDVFAVMGSIFSESSRGANKMITLGHAKGVSQIEDIIEEYNLAPLIEKKKEKDLSSPEQAIIDFLQGGEKSFQEIVDGTGLGVSTLNTLLTKMTIKGVVKKLAGNTYFLKWFW